MAALSFALFDTAIGRCAIAWSARGIAGVHLPEHSEAATRARIARRHPGAVETAPTADIEAATAGITALLAGDPTDLTGVAVDMDAVPAYDRRVYELARTIPPGATLTYGEIAARLGDPRSARAVGQALGNNPFPLVVPCHRVVAADGTMHGFSAPGGVVTKLRLLQIEGYERRTPSLFDSQPAKVYVKGAISWVSGGHPRRRPGGTRVK